MERSAVILAIIFEMCEVRLEVFDTHFAVEGKRQKGKKRAHEPQKVGGMEGNMRQGRSWHLI